MFFKFRFVTQSIKNFSYVFIDDAEKATEPDTVIPFILKADSRNKNILFVLSGDPKKLRPVIISKKFAQRILGT